MDRDFPDSTLAPARHAMPEQADHARDARITEILTAPAAEPRTEAAAYAFAVLDSSRVAIGTALADVGLTSEVSEEVSAAIQDHAEAIAAGRAETDDSDEAFHRHADRQNATDSALRATPCRSLADLRAKLTYLVPVMAPDMLDKTHAAQLRAIVGDMDRLCRERSRPADAHGDVELLRLGEQFDRVHARWRASRPGYAAAHEHVGRMIAAAKARGGVTSDDIKAAWDAPGITEANDLFEAISNELDPICEAIWATPHATPAGLAVKARAAIPHAFVLGDFEEGAGLGASEDLPAKPARRLIEACCTLAGVDWRGDLIAPPRSASIYATPTPPLVADILAGWAEWATSQGFTEGVPEQDATYDRHQVIRDGLLDAADALPATLENVPAKALACAWMEWVAQERPGQPRESYPLDARYVFDIQAAIVGAPTASGDTGPAPAPLPAPGSEEAKAAFKAACHEHTVLTQFANGYPDLKRTPLEWWTAQSLSRALETGELPPAEVARLYPLATERELRMAEIGHRLRLGSLHALAFADTYPVPGGTADEPDGEDGRDLSDLTLSDLAHLHMVASTTWTTSSMYLNAPFAWDGKRENYGPLGKIIEAEVDRWEGLAGDVAREAARRQSTDDDGDLRLEIAVRHHMLGGGPIEDPALAREINAAWGA